MLFLHRVMSPRTNGESVSKAEEHHGPRTGVENLPVEISHDILARLPVSSLVQCRYVSQSWRQLSHEVSLLNLHLLRIGKKNPSLIFHCLDSARNQLGILELSDRSPTLKNKKKTCRNHYQLSIGKKTWYINSRKPNNNNVT